MFTLGPPLWSSEAAPAGLALPYTMTFNYASKAAMLADYEAQGFTMPDGLAGSDVSPGVLMLRTTYGIDTESSTEPFNSQIAGVKSAYLAGNTTNTYPYNYTITLPPGTLAKQVDFDYFTSAASLFVVITYTDASTFEFERAGAMLDLPFLRRLAYPDTPPVGAIYIESITFRYVADGGRWATDNIRFLA